LVGFTSVPFKVVSADPGAPPVIPPVTLGAFQLNVVFAGTVIDPLVVSVLENVVLLQ
jgi:hypothetical protein